MTELKNNFDLEERTMRFSQNLIVFLKACPQNNLTLPLINVYGPEPVLELIIVRQTVLQVRKTFITKYIFVKKNQKKHFTG